MPQIAGLFSFPRGKTSPVPKARRFRNLPCFRFAVSRAQPAKFPTWYTVHGPWYMSKRISNAFALPLISKRTPVGCSLFFAARAWCETAARRDWLGSGIFCILCRVPRSFSVLRPQSASPDEDPHSRGRGVPILHACSSSETLLGGYAWKTPSW